MLFLILGSYGWSYPFLFLFVSIIILYFFICYFLVLICNFFFARWPCKRTQGHLNNSQREQNRAGQGFFDKATGQLMWRDEETGTVWAILGII